MKTDMQSEGDTEMRRTVSRRAGEEEAVNDEEDRQDKNIKE